MTALNKIGSKYKKEIIILLFIIVAAAFVRLYRIVDYMHFLGDEGRDVLVVKRMIVDHDLTLLGPITSVGSMYLGPIYYYFMTPFLFIFNMNPVGPAVMIALLSLATIILLYITGTEFFNWETGVIASLLYTFSPLVIVHSRFSWNPNAVPFFALLIIYSLLKVVIKKQYLWMYVAGLSLGVILQLHYLALMFIPIILIVLFLFRRLSLKGILKIILATVITLSPFLIFEIKHSFPNTQTALRFITRDNSVGKGATFALVNLPFKIYDLTLRSFWRIVVSENSFTSKLVIVFIITTFILIYRNRKKVDYSKQLIILLVWYIFAIVSLSLYQGAVYDYYLVQIFPLPSLLTGIVLSWYLKNKLIFRFFALAIIFLLLYFQLKNSPLLKEPNRLLTLTRERAQFISDQAGSEKYNFALITGSNSDHAYRYFLELWGKKPVTIKNPDQDPTRLTVTDQLYVICETETCAPLGNPLWEVAGFGRAEIAEKWEVSGATIYKLVHYFGE